MGRCGNATVRAAGLPTGNAKRPGRCCEERCYMAAEPAKSETVEVIFSAEAIAEGIDAMARRIAQSESRDLLVIAILKGSFVFAADLLRALYRAGLSPQVDFLSLSSYRSGTKSSGRVEIVRDIEI